MIFTRENQQNSSLSCVHYHHYKFCDKKSKNGHHNKNSTTGDSESDDWSMSEKIDQWSSIFKSLKLTTSWYSKLCAYFALICIYAPNEVWPLKINVKDSALSTSQNYTFRLRLYDNETSQEAWINTLRSIDVSKRIYAEIQIKQNKDATDDDLLATPKDCYFSLNSNPIAAEQRYMILTSGCPALKVDVRFFDQKSANQTARFSLPIDFYFVDRLFMFFHCKVVACSKRGGREEENFEKCPSKDYCSSSASRLSTVPKPAYAYVSSGLLRPVITGARRYPVISTSNTRKEAAAPSIAYGGNAFPVNTATGQQQCPPCPVDDVASSSSPESIVSGNGHQQQQDRVVVTRGMDSVTVFAVAAASFVVGVLLMAGLCYVHRITEPKKYNAAKNFRKEAAWSSCVTNHNGHHHHVGCGGGIIGEATVTTPMTTMSGSSSCNGACQAGHGHHTSATTCATGTCSNSMCSGIGGMHSNRCSSRSTGTANTIIRFAKSPASLFKCCLPFGNEPTVSAEYMDEREPMEKCDSHGGVIILSDSAACLNPDQCGGLNLDLCGDLNPDRCIYRYHKQQEQQDAEQDTQQQDQLILSNNKFFLDKDHLQQEQLD